jgi:hypothetical protein
MAEAMPFCMMKGYERYVSEFHIQKPRSRNTTFTIDDYDKVRKEELKSKFPQCKDCRYDLICEGPWKEYPKTGQQGIQPVLEKKLTHPTSFLSHRHPQPATKMAKTKSNDSIKMPNAKIRHCQAR